MLKLLAGPCVVQVMGNTFFLIGVYYPLSSILFNRFTFFHYGNPYMNACGLECFRSVCKCMPLHHFILSTRKQPLHFQIRRSISIPMKLMVCMKIRKSKNFGTLKAVGLFLKNLALKFFVLKKMFKFSLALKN